MSGAAKTTVHSLNQSFVTAIAKMTRKQTQHGDWAVKKKVNICKRWNLDTQILSTLHHIQHQHSLTQHKYINTVSYYMKQKLKALQEVCFFQNKTPLSYLTAALWAKLLSDDWKSDHPDEKLRPR